MIVDKFEYAKCNGDIHFFPFPPEIPPLGKFGTKIQNCQFKLKPGINSSVLDQKYPLWANQNYQFKLKFGT